jgi:undecaprenyl-diphosphatase
MSPLQALVLGVVQGATEFLPISSSGHLLVVPYLLGWDEHPLAFDVALHIGTLLAVLIYFRRDWFELLRATLQDLARHRARLRDWSTQGRLTLLIALGTIPAVVVGVLIGPFEDALRSPVLAAVMLILVSGYMAAADRLTARGPSPLSMTSLTPARVLAVGVAQACALVPGVSRSGATIATGMFAGLSRATAARFSFLLATPVTLAAALKETPNLRFAAAQGITGTEVAIGIVASFVVGIVAIAFLLRFLATRSLTVFVIYRLLLAAVVLFVAVR